MELGKEKAERCFGARRECVLPNGLEIVHLNQYETDYVYKEIFEDQCYLRHGIRLQDGDTVVDIGANIGLFSLFVMSRCKNPKIYACEPAPVVYDLLKANCDAYGSNVRALNVGVADKRKTATFTFYEKSSVFSGFHSDETEDREAIQAVVRNMLSRIGSGRIRGGIRQRAHCRQAPSQDLRMPIDIRVGHHPGEPDRQDRPSQDRCREGRAGHHQGHRRSRLAENQIRSCSRSTIRRARRSSGSNTC